MHKLNVIYEDPNVIVINKPAGLLCLPDRFNDDPSVLSILKRYYPEGSLCHRIDRDTSGILLLVKDKKDLSFLAKQFENRSVEKNTLP